MCLLLKASLYNFTICQGTSKCTQNKDNTFSYLWTENEYAKGSSQIASSVYHRLQNSSLEGIKKIKLFSDGCGGQNKNRSIVTMLLHWLEVNSPSSVQSIELYFPVVGHSSIPPDRVFGKLEKQFRKFSVIKNSTEYFDIIDKYCTIVRLGENADVRDWKAYGEDITKVPGNWHFQFQRAKKLEITKSRISQKCIVQGEPFYNFESGESKSILKRGKACKRLPPKKNIKGCIAKI